MKVEPRDRLLALDGLRGIAALAVFLLHLKLQPYRIVPSASLAVDFFFLLSGFVLARAYEERLKAPASILTFIRDRIIRLHPLLVMSVVIAALVVALGGASRHDRFPALTLVVMAIPFPPLWVRGVWAMSFLYNNPVWSLFWELGANLVFALSAPRLRTRTLAVITVLLMLCGFALSLRTGGLVKISVLAALRAFPAFALGVLLHRIYLSRRVELPRWTALLTAPLLIVSFTPPLYAPVSGILHPMTVYFIYPFIILAAAEHKTRFPRLCEFAGGFSYPLYILHVPVLGVFLALGTPRVLMPFACLAIIWLIWRFYDEPLRTWLRSRFGSACHRSADLPQA